VLPRCSLSFQDWIRHHSISVFAIFFPIDIAIALTGIVHLLNNFQSHLTAKEISLSIFLRFGIPSIIGAFLGAFLLNRLGNIHSLYIYGLGDHVVR